MASPVSHSERIFIGEGNFTGVKSLLKKHPNLAKSIIATELKTFGRTSDFCPRCNKKYDRQDEDTTLGLAIMNLFIENGSERKGIFCSTLCKRIQSLKDKGVTIILGYDGTKMHKHPLTKGKKFKHIHWICPHDGSNYTDQTLPPIINAFFQSASRMQQQENSHIHITLAQPITPHDKTKFYQGAVYNICKAARAIRYRLYAKRPFGATRYPGYRHEQTTRAISAAGAERQREFVFIRGSLPADRPTSKLSSTEFRIGPTRGVRSYYIRDTDDESSDYSDDEKS